MSPEQFAVVMGTYGFRFSYISNKLFPVLKTLKVSPFDLAYRTSDEIFALVSRTYGDVNPKKNSAWIFEVLDDIEKVILAEFIAQNTITVQAALWRILAHARGLKSDGVGEE